MQILNSFPAFSLFTYFFSPSPPQSYLLLLATSLYPLLLHHFLLLTLLAPLPLTPSSLSPQSPPCGLNLVVYWIYLRIFDRFDWEELLHTALGGEFIIYMRSVEISWWEHNHVNSFSSYLLWVPGRVGTFHRMHPSTWFIVKW